MVARRWVIHAMHPDAADGGNRKRRINASRKTLCARWVTEMTGIARRVGVCGGGLLRNHRVVLVSTRGRTRIVRSLVVTPGLLEGILSLNWRRFFVGGIIIPGIGRRRWVGIGFSLSARVVGTSSIDIIRIFRIESVL